MKHTSIAFVLLALLLSCGDGITENTMTVTGQVKGLKKGVLYLQHIPDSTLAVADSIQIDGDGHFSLSAELESPEVFYLYLNKKDNNAINDRITFFGEPGTITINTVWNTFDKNADIKGSETHEKLEEYQKMMSRFNRKQLEIMQQALNKELNLSTAELDSLQQLGDKNDKRSYAFALTYALNNKESHIAPYIAVHGVPDANPKYLDSILSVLPPEIADSKYGRALAAILKKNNSD
ncbi:DUF4369 domain-containing protein [Maribacter sp. 2-571]|uniref:DUF4369 domain-containing protein n=1 Tax=Maribacter sp. 2-571 TaxID=3417569 RepID=UPI003D342F98